MNSYEADNFMAAKDGKDVPPLSAIFAEAIKGPFRSSDSQVQLGTLDLLFHYLSCEGASGKHIQVLVEEDIADYVFEILILSECRDPVINSCIQVLDILSMAGQAFKQRLFVGFATLIPVVRCVAEIRFHPAQSQTLKLIWNYVSDCPRMLSNSQIEELALVFTRMLQRHTEGEIGMLPQDIDNGLLSLRSSYEAFTFLWDPKSGKISSRSIKICHFRMSRYLRKTSNPNVALLVPTERGISVEL